MTRRQNRNLAVTRNRQRIKSFLKIVCEISVDNYLVSFDYQCFMGHGVVGEGYVREKERRTGQWSETPPR